MSMSRGQFATFLLAVVIAGLVGGTLSSHFQGTRAVAQERVGEVGSYDLQVVYRPGQTTRLILLDTRSGEVWDYNWAVGPDVKWRKFPDHQSAVRGAINE